MMKLSSVLMLFFLTRRSVAQNEECGAPILSQRWDNMTVPEGGTGIFRCPLDTSSSCLVDVVEWYQMKTDGSRALLRDRIEVFSFDPLLMYMTDVVKEDRGWYVCVAGNALGRGEAKIFMDVLEMPEFRVIRTTTAQPSTTTNRPEETILVVDLPNQNVDRQVALQMSTAVLSPVTETPPETTTTTTPRSNKWERFQVYSKYRGSRVSYPGAGYGAAYRAALSASNVTLIPRYEEDMLTSTTTTTTRKPYWITTTRSPRTFDETTTSPFKLYYDMANKQQETMAGSGKQIAEARQPETTSRYGWSGSTTSDSVWSRGGKDTLPQEVAAQLTHRDHLEAIHNHLRYIYDRMDDLLDRIHKLEEIHRS